MHFLLILQAYLSDSEFQTVFGMTKDAFYQQPNWKQELQKRKADLFWREQASYLVSAIKFDPLIVNGSKSIIYYQLCFFLRTGYWWLCSIGFFFFCNQFYRSILLFVHGLSCAACEVLIYSSLLCDCPYVCIIFFHWFVTYGHFLVGHPWFIVLLLRCIAHEIFVLSVCCWWLTIERLWLNLSTRTNKWPSLAIEVQGDVEVACLPA